jgi:hypothetical protein
MNVTPDKISVVGHSAQYEYSVVADTVVKLSGRWYFKHDTERVVRIKDMSGNRRFYRINSPLLFYDPIDERYYLKSEAVVVDGVYLNPRSSNVVKTVDDKYARRNFCVEISPGRHVLKTDSTRLVMGPNGMLIAAAGTIPMAPVYQAKRNLGYLLAVPTKTAYKSTDYIVLDGVVYAKRDITEIMGSNGEISVYFYIDSANEPLLTESVLPNPGLDTMDVFRDFQDKTNPQLGRYVLVRAFVKDKDSYIIIPELNTAGFPGGVHVHINQRDYVLEAYKRFIEPRIISATPELVAQANKNFSDAGPDENLATHLVPVPEPFAGKQALFSVPGGVGLLLSTTRSRTDRVGGLHYSFGVELETSNGLLTQKLAAGFPGLRCVGDRSIGAGEYVTPPLFGSVGVRYLADLCGLLSKYTVVDDRCGLHIHVGFPLDTDMKFTRHTAVHAIKLGCLLEAELYQSLPLSRVPTLYHCHSILRWWDTDKDWRKYIGAYIFGPREKWVTSSNKPMKPFTFDGYLYGKEGMNAKINLGNWPEGRYKWLNIIPFMTSGGTHTLEFRIFSGTTSFDKIYHWLLTCMSFVHVVYNRPSMIRPGVTLTDVFDATFGKKRIDLVDSLNTFFQNRVAKFNRPIDYGYPVNHKGLDIDWDTLLYKK